MITTRHSFATIMTIVLTVILIFGLGITGTTAESTAEPTDEEKLAEWYVSRDNIRTRVAELLSTDEQLKDGIGPDNIDYFITAYYEIEREENTASQLRLYPDLASEEMIAARRADRIFRKYARSSNAPNQTYYQDLWDATVARLNDLVDDGAMTTLWYKVMPYSSFRFESGETFQNYLSRTGKIGEGISENEAMLAYVDLLANCTVDDYGYLVYHAPDGTEQTVLAWYDTVLKHYNEDDFVDADLISLP